MHQVRSPIHIGRGTLFSMILLAGAIQPSVTPARAEDAETSLRRGIAWQVALESLGFSPGLVDGKPGRKTKIATWEFQRVKGLPKTGELDKATAEALKVDPDGAIMRYTVQQSEVDDVEPVPHSWVAKSKMKKLGYDNLEEALAERCHCTRALLQTLNPGKNLSALKVGDKFVGPAVAEAGSSPPAGHLEVNLNDKIIRVIDREKQLAALFHCSVAANKAKLPSGNAEVELVAANPEYTYDPKMWPEVTEKITSKLTIPPGPRNPVGRCWIQLTLPGYGMHGSPHPEMIGKTGSHGCFRLTNWDALRLAKMVRAGTPVKFFDTPSEAAQKIQ
jgi:lipoprotein-anchoring transpeptidase ErfK/SrfK